jgi:hypothetical protein
MPLFLFEPDKALSLRAFSIVVLAGFFFLTR